MSYVHAHKSSVTPGVKRPDSLIWELCFLLLGHPLALSVSEPGRSFICIFPVEKLMRNQGWEDVRPMTMGTKGVFVRSLHQNVGELQMESWSNDGLMNPTVKDLPVFSSPFTMFPFVWAIISSSDGMTFYPQQAVIEHMLPTGIISIDLHITLLCPEEPPQATADKWRWKSPQEEAG